MDSLHMIHLSDLHLGPYSRFAGLDPANLARGLCNAIELERRRADGFEAPISLVVVTGDIAEAARPDQYALAEAFFESMSEGLHLSRDRFVFIPGNHDVSWYECQRIALDQIELSFDDLEFQRRATVSKLNRFFEFVQRFRGPPDSSRQELSPGAFMYDFEDIGVSFAALNSCEIESHRSADHIGSVSELQAQAFDTFWQSDKRPGLIRLVGLHHNPMPASPEDVDSWLKFLEERRSQGEIDQAALERFAADAVGLRGRKYIRALVEDCRVPLLLHGHYHRDVQEAWTWRGGRRGQTHILGAGSWGLTPDKLPIDQPNGLQLIVLEPKASEIRARMFVYESRGRLEGQVGTGIFVVDPANPGGYVQSVSLESVSVRHSATGPATERARIPSPPDPYFADVYAQQTNFTGRFDERGILTGWWRKGGESILAILGLGGMGKSALAWTWLQRDVTAHAIPGMSDPEEVRIECQVLEADRPEGILWWSFYEHPGGFEEFLSEALAYCSKNAMDVVTRWSAHTKVRELILMLSQKRFLLVLDGFERCLKAYSALSSPYSGDASAESHADRFRRCTDRSAAEFLRQMSAPHIASRILLTTRLLPEEIDGLAGVRVLELSSLDPDDAVLFLLREGISGTPTDIRSVCAQYGYHPLALRLLAGLINADAASPGDISIAGKFDATPRLVRREHHVLAAAYDSLLKDRQELLGRLAAFRGSMTYEAVRAACGFEDESRLPTALRDLIDRGLLAFSPDGKYDLHPIVRKFAYDNLVRKRETHLSLRDYFARVPLPLEVERLEDFAPVFELYHHAIQAGLYEYAWGIYTDRLWEPLSSKFEQRSLSIQLVSALFPDGIDKLTPGLSRRARMMALTDLGWLLYGAGQYSEALKPVELAASMATRSEPSREAGALTVVAAILEGRGELKESRATFEKALALATKGHDRGIECQLRRLLGRALTIAGHYDLAMEELDRSMDMRTSISATALAISHKAYVLWRLNRFQDSLEMIREIEPTSDEPHRAVMRNVGSARAMVSLAETTVGHERSQSLDEAEQLLDKALRHVRRVGRGSWEDEILHELGNLYLQRGNLAEAKRFVDEALAITIQSGDHLQEAEHNLLLARINVAASDPSAARIYAKRALELAGCDGPGFSMKACESKAAGILALLRVE